MKYTFFDPMHSTPPKDALQANQEPDSAQINSEIFPLLETLEGDAVKG